jgi:hypothetical protein
MFEPPRPPHRKRYGWFRLYNGFFDHPKWRLIARHADVPLTDVHSVVGKILEAANKGRPRGDISEFSILETAAALDIRADEVGRIYAALEDVGWIDRQYVTTWDDRQPDLDPTNAERQARHRRRKKIIELNQSMSRVTVTPDSDSVSKKEATDEEEAQKWRQAHLPLSPVVLRPRGNR